MLRKTHISLSLEILEEPCLFVFHKWYLGSSNSFWILYGQAWGVSKLMVHLQFARRQNQFFDSSADSLHFPLRLYSVNKQKQNKEQKKKNKHITHCNEVSSYCDLNLILMESLPAVPEPHFNGVHAVTWTSSSWSPFLPSGTSGHLQPPINPFILITTFPTRALLLASPYLVHDPHWGFFFFFGYNVVLLATSPQTVQFIRSNHLLRII